MSGNIVAGFAAAAHCLEGAVALVQGVDGFAHVVVIEAVAAEAVLQTLLHIIAVIDNAVISFHGFEGVLDGVTRCAAAVVRVEEVVVPRGNGLALHVAGLSIQSYVIEGRFLDLYAVVHGDHSWRVLFVRLFVLVP